MMKIVCFGDSLTSCGGHDGRYSDILQDRFPNHEFINRGVGGETFVDALERIDIDVLEESPDIVLIEFGANDWWRDERPPESWAADLEICIQKARQVGAEPVILGVFGKYLNEQGQETKKESAADERSDTLHLAEATLATKYQCPHVPNIQRNIIGQRCCWRDRNHPNEYGNRFVADTIEPILEDLLGCQAQPVRKPNLATIRDFWDEAVRTNPDQIAAVCEDRRISYGEADLITRKLAGAIAAQTGVSRPKVAVFLPNCLEYFLTYWAVAKLGGIIIPLNTWLREDALTGIFQKTKPDCLIVRTKHDKLPLKAASLAKTKTIISVAKSADILEFDHMCRSDEECPVVDIDPTDPAIVMHTSGTTSVPKGAVMRHQDLMFNVMTTINAHQFSPSDIHLLVNPMFHCTALYSSLTTAAYQKAPVVITAHTTPDKLLKLIAKENVTTFLSTPVIFQNIVNYPDIQEFQIPSVRLMAYAGSPMPVKTIQKLQNLYPNIELHNFFGLTETISMTHVLNGEEATGRPHSVGRLLPFVEAIVVDEEGNELPRNTVGELWFARDNVIPGYYQDSRLEHAIEHVNGRDWFSTGDLAMIDDDGYFFIKGRKKDMIIVGGENVYASEVESVLRQHRLIVDAAVKGIPATGVRASLGEVVKAYVVTKDPYLDEREIRRFCHDKLAVYKIPVYVEFLGNLPRNPSGKILKDELD